MGSSTMSDFMTRWLPLHATHLVAAVFVLFCVSCFKSYEELQYLSGSRTVTTEITAIGEAYSMSRRSMTQTGWKLYYPFDHVDSPKTLRGFTIVGMDEVDDYHIGQEVTIEYIGGRKTFSSRIVGTGSYAWVIPAGGCLVAMIVGVLYIIYGPTRIPT